MKQDLLYLSALALLTVALTPTVTNLGLPILSVGLAAFPALLLILSIYFIIERKLSFKFYGIPILMLIIIGLSYMSMAAPNDALARDYFILSIIFSIHLLVYAGVIHEIIPARLAVLSIVVSAIIIHVLPAQTPYISALDPYWFYRFTNHLLETGDIIQWDYMTYPPEGHSVVGRMMLTVIMATMTQVMQPLGITSHDVAMVISGLMAGLIPFLAYMLSVELFPENKNKHYVGLLAAFTLFASKGLALRGIATNAEDDGTGLFFIVTTFALIFTAFNRKSFRLTLLAGFSFLMLALTWAGYEYTVMILGLYMGLYAILQFKHNKNTVAHLPYFVLPYLVSVMFIPILHRNIFDWSLPPVLMLGALGFGVGASVILEIIRLKRQPSDGDDNLWFRKNLTTIQVVTVISCIIGAAVILPEVSLNLFNFKAHGILDLTTAETRGSGFDLKALHDHFGVIALFGLMVTPLLIYRIWKKNDFGALFLLAYGLTGIYGFTQMSRFAFIVSVPVALLGSAVMLYLPRTKKEWASMRVITPLVLLVVLPSYIPFTYDNPMSQPVFMMMHMGAGQDRYVWQPFFDYLNDNTPDDYLVMSWWDYGHWITALAPGTRSMLDNTKADALMVQDVANIHVVDTDERTALARVEEARPDMFVIDWTMIPKSGAPHFIATSNIFEIEHGSWLGYGMCGFSKELSAKGQIRSKDDGTFEKTPDTLVFPCNSYISALVFEISENNVEIKVQLGAGTVNFDQFYASKPMAVLGVAPPGEILQLAMQRPNDQLVPTARTFIIAPRMEDKGVLYDYPNVMMTKLYLGEYAQDYYKVGLCKEDWCRDAPNHLEYFMPIPELSGFGGATSGGYVRAWSINWTKYDKYLNE